MRKVRLVSIAFTSNFKNNKPPNAGKSLVGCKGDLVCTRPFPCQPVFFWNDADGSKYQKAYFSQFKGVWYHGDFISINPKTRGIWMLGRSDGTLNPSGVRIGSAEIYNLGEICSMSNRPVPPTY